MENQSIANPSDISSINPAAINQPPIQPQTKTSLIIPILITLLASAVLFGVGGYYLGTQSIKSQQNLNSVQNQPISTIAPQITIVSPTPTSQQVAVIPSGWSYKTNNECGVKLAIPPKSAPYSGSDGRFWDFPRGSSYPNLLSRVFLTNQEYKQASTMYATVDEASGYIAQAVVVSCIPNNGRYIDNNQLLSALTSEINKYNSSTGEKGMQASTYTIKSNTPTQRWNKDVIDLMVAEDSSNFSYTMFVTPQFIYEVKMFGAMEDSSAKNTAKQIFDNLTF